MVVAVKTQMDELVGSWKVTKPYLYCGNLMNFVLVIFMTISMPCSSMQHYESSVFLHKNSSIDSNNSVSTFTKAKVSTLIKRVISVVT